MIAAEKNSSASLIQVHTNRPAGSPGTVSTDAAALEQDLRAALRGEVRFSQGDRGMYASDAGNYRMIPIGVILPRDSADAEAALAVCRRHGAPIVARGGGTGIPGQTVNVAVVFDFSKYMNRILELNPGERYARVEPGIVLDECAALRAATA